MESSIVYVRQDWTGDLQVREDIKLTLKNTFTVINKTLLTESKVS